MRLWRVRDQGGVGAGGGGREREESVDEIQGMSSSSSLSSTKLDQRHNQLDESMIYAVTRIKKVIQLSDDDVLCCSYEVTGS